MPNQIAWDILLVLVTVAGNLCNECPKWLLKQNSSYSDYFSVISGLYRTAEPQEALWQYYHRANMTQATDRIFKLTSVYTLVIGQIA